MFLRRKTNQYNKRGRDDNFGFFYLILIVLFVSGFVIAILYFMLFSDFFKVKSTEVSGLRTVSKDELLANIKSHLISSGIIRSLLGPDNILFWRINSGKIDFNNVVPKISSVFIDASLKSRNIVISAEEREVYGIWCVSDNECYAFDKNGIIFSRAPVPEGILLTRVENLNIRQPVFGSALLPKEDWTRNFFNTFDSIRKNNIPISKTIIKDYALREWEAVSPVGFSMYFSFNFIPDNLDFVLQNISSRVDFKNLLYIDFRIPNRLFYK